MSEKEPALPKYQLVKDYVLAQIENQEITKDDRIPSESEFSKMLNVSSITVRKALSELVNEGVIYRIRGKGSFVAASQTAIAEKASNLVAFVISGVEMYDSSYMQIMKGIQSFLGKNDCKLIIEFVENNFEEERELILRLLQSGIRGLLIYSSDPVAAKSYLNDVRKKSIPFVMLDRYPPGYPVNVVTCNNHDGAYEAVEYLIRNGHTQIGFAAYDFHLSPEVDRYNGYNNAIADASLPSNRKLLYLEKELDYDALTRQIQEGEITALFCANDKRALEVLEQLTSRGIRIPEQISLMGFDDFESSKFAKVALSTVKQYFDVLGYESAKLLFEISEGNSYGNKKVMLPTSLVIRDTVSPV
ncbi:GntR family transcriptional regulator, arabinose operon transcriptional repressor [Paenibacillus catalpae]|uniref:GntR family transcriptional regulator, arabinose operon transcriptional repressor n=1 Tax=Paenibacillus catalpae TaxID=1045775 RepID=A0A1I1SZC5_9BACL|nr:GntR family transcriptional regulator [Paenibacillus catalpae]SFD51805.1 GntR family transcriptional regulator, arabinose operon transcriptional repressor [Paenibacillus catalpae]